MDIIMSALKYILKMIAGMGMALFVAVAGFSFNVPVQGVEEHFAEAAVKPTIIETPKAVEASKTQELKMAANRLVIPVIGVNAKVLGMGLTDDGKMAVPDNFTEVGWYKLGSAPGEAGTTVMGAHVDNGGRVAGVFKNLKNLKVGNVVYVSDAAGSVLQYKVTSRKIYDRKLTDTTAVFASSGASRLNLITCYGTWLPWENTYASRLVVSAELVSAKLGLNSSST